MKICFVDEAGDLGAVALPPRQNDQPVLVIGGLFLDVANLYGFTQDFLHLKSLYFPNLPYPSQQPLDRILVEVKGQDLRRNLTRGTRRQNRHAVSFLDCILRLLTGYDAKLVARICVKAPGNPFDATSVYTSAMQSVCSYFDRCLAQSGVLGVCIADSRNKFKNVKVSHSIFTQKFGQAPHQHQRLVDLPAFGHSDNHAGLQVCDIVCSALLYPIACFAYCTGHVNNVHVQPQASLLRQRYGQQLRDLQYRYFDAAGNRHRGGITVSDAINQQSALCMFR